MRKLNNVTYFISLSLRSRAHKLNYTQRFNMRGSGGEGISYRNAYTLARITWRDVRYSDIIFGARASRGNFTIFRIIQTSVWSSARIFVLCALEGSCVYIYIYTGMR